MCGQQDVDLFVADGDLDVAGGDGGAGCNVPVGLVHSYSPFVDAEGERHADSAFPLASLGAVPSKIMINYYRDQSFLFRYVPD